MQLLHHQQRTEARVLGNDSQDTRNSTPLRRNLNTMLIAVQAKQFSKRLLNNNLWNHWCWRRTECRFLDKSQCATGMSSRYTRQLYASTYEENIILIFIGLSFALISGTGNRPDCRSSRRFGGDWGVRE